MDVSSPFIACREKPVGSVKPRDRSLDDPSMATEALFGFDSAARDSRNDAANAATGATEDMVVRLVGVELRRSEARPTPRALNARDLVEHRLQHVAVGHVGRRDVDDEGHTLAVDDQMLLGAEFPSVRRVRAGLRAPPFARTLEASSDTRDQSILSARPSSSSRARWSRSHTPASCQSRRRRQHVIPLPQPISRGRYSQPIPVRSTKRMPASAARSPTGGRPPRGFARAGGIRGSMRTQSASGTSGFAMGRAQYPSIATRAKFC